METRIDIAMNNEVMDGFKSLLLARDHSVSDGDIAFAGGMVAAWNATENMDGPIVFAAECGFGKSTLLEIYLRHMTFNDPHFGAIVVKQKKDEVEALTNAINRNPDADGREGIRYRRAFAIRGYDPLAMTYKSYSRQFSRQAYYPVIVMTAEMFARQSTMRLLDRFSSFYDRDEQRRPRRLLVIDERPVLTRTHSMSVDDVNQLIEDVREITHVSKHRDAAANYREFLGCAQRLRAELEACDGRGRIEPIDFEYFLPDDLRRLWSDSYDGDRYDALATFESTVRFGGAVHLRRGVDPVITVSHRIYYEWTAYRPFILDATAATDPYYAAGNFTVIESPTPHSYGNVQFYVCNGENLSKSFFESHPQSFEEAAAMVKEISAKHSKTMVVFYKEHLPQLESYLSDEIETGTVLTKHFDSGRATNDFKDCDAAVFLGWLLKGETYYPQVASAIYDELLSYDSYTDVSGVHYRDERVESFKLGEIVTERIQDVHRIRPRASTYPVSVYLFHRDEEIIRKIIGSFPGSSQREFIPQRRLSGRLTHADNLIDFLKVMERGSRVKSKEIYETIGMSQRQFSRIQEDPRVIAAMRESGVEKERTFYIKRAQ
ncbi:hypothetical protein [Paenibacillus sp. ISL-20]|uniref:hypothetical protein n=1 Tax=Paenibacillus sp. ISL-20 TaxID=2819163 RepID=UPI001BE77EFF|nr:hypothetical protein [Paenibacillus sp. ISL-20]MBT2761873.1 hypothetical protein [Paenibacillus sp. ISL-20]